jgi:hypothetical protein
MRATRVLAALLAALALAESAPAPAQQRPAADRAQRDQLRRRTAQLRAICIRRRREQRNAPPAPAADYRPPEWLMRGSIAPPPEMSTEERTRRIQHMHRQIEMLRPRDPRHGDALLLLGELQVLDADAAVVEGDELRRDRRRAEATQVLEELLRLHPNHPRLEIAVLLLARVLEALGERPRAAWVLRDWSSRLGSHAGVPFIWVAAADLFAADDQTATALGFYERAIAAAPERTPIHAYALFRMALLLRDLGDRREAGATFVRLMIFLDTHAATIPDVANLRGAADREICTALR